MLIAGPSRTEPSPSIAKTRSALLPWAWGAGAALALVAAVTAGRTDLGSQRARAAVTAMLSPPHTEQQASRRISALSGEQDDEMRRQAEMLQALTEQRDRLGERLGVLERRIDELGATLARTAARLEGDRSVQQMAAAASAVVADPWPATPARPYNAKALPRALSIARVFRSNPLMTTGILTFPAEPAPIAAEFAVDLGAASTIGALRARWNELRINQSPLLDSLRPLVALKDDAKSGQALHLVAGPLTNNSAALRLCAVLAATGAPCQPAPYEGQQLAAQ